MSWTSFTWNFPNFWLIVALRLYDGIRLGEILSLLSYIILINYEIQIRESDLFTSDSNFIFYLVLFDLQAV